MRKIKCWLIGLYCFCGFTHPLFSQNDAAVYNVYYNCFGTIPASEDMSRDRKFITGDTASLKNLLNNYLEIIHNSADMQKKIIARAFKDSYGNVSEHQIDSCFKIKQNNTATYQSLTGELKNGLIKNIQTIQSAIIQRSYFDYFGVQVDKNDNYIKNWLDSSVNNKGILYKTLMEEHRLHIIAAPDEQKAIITRAFFTAFGRQIKVAELDSWFNVCKYGCSFAELEKQFEARKNLDPKGQPPVLAAAGMGDIIYIRYGVILNEACNCTGNKVFLLNTDAVNSYKVVIAYYNLQLNTTTVSELVMPPRQEKLMGCTKDLDCIQSITYSILSYKKI